MQPPPSDGSNDVFEIRDFSVATPWEAFVCSIEEAVRAWMSGSENSDVGYDEHELRHEGGHAYVLRLHGDGQNFMNRRSSNSLPLFMHDMLDQASDFTSVAFSLDVAARIRRWYGLTAFALLAPKDVGSLDGHEMTMMQSALNIALDSCQCQGLPCFVLHEVESGDLYGRSLANSIGCRFDVELLRTAAVPEACRKVAGLVELFRSKIQLEIDPPPTHETRMVCSALAAGHMGHKDECKAPRITVTRRHTFILDSWSAWQRPTFGPGNLSLELGGKLDPLPRLALSFQWFHLPDELEMMNDDPSTASECRVRAILEEPRPSLFSDLVKIWTPLTARVRTLIEGWEVASRRMAAKKGHEDEQVADGRQKAEKWMSIIRGLSGSMLSNDEVEQMMDAVMSDAERGPTGSFDVATDQSADNLVASNSTASISSGAAPGSLLHRIGLAILRDRSTTRRSAHPMAVLVQMWGALIPRLRRTVESPQEIPNVVSCRLSLNPGAGLSAACSMQLVSKCHLLLHFADCKRNCPRGHSYSSAAAVTGIVLEIDYAFGDC